MHFGPSTFCPRRSRRRIRYFPSYRLLLLFSCRVLAGVCHGGSRIADRTEISRVERHDGTKGARYRIFLVDFGGCDMMGKGVLSHFGVCLFSVFSFSRVQVLAHLMEHTVEEGQSMCLVASSWWSYWSSYAGLTKEDVLRVPERLALGLHKTEGYLDHAPTDEPLATMAMGVQVAGSGTSGGASASLGGNGNGHARGTQPQPQPQAVESSGGVGKERAVPTMLARRPHEIDNSSLQVRDASCALAFEGHTAQGSRFCQ